LSVKSLQDAIKEYDGLIIGEVRLDYGAILVEVYRFLKAWDIRTEIRTDIKGILKDKKIDGFPLGGSVFNKESNGKLETYFLSRVVPFFTSISPVGYLFFYSEDDMFYGWR